jgi:hypothetical protein
MVTSQGPNQEVGYPLHREPSGGAPNVVITNRGIPGVAAENRVLLSGSQFQPSSPLNLKNMIQSRVVPTSETTPQLESSQQTIQLNKFDKPNSSLLQDPSQPLEWKTFFQRIPRPQQPVQTAASANCDLCVMTGTESKEALEKVKLRPPLNDILLMIHLISASFVACRLQTLHLHGL